MHAMFWLDKLRTYFIRTWNVHCTKHRNKYQRHRWEKNHVRSDNKPVLCPEDVNLRGNTENCNRRHERCQQRQRHRYSHHTAVSEQKFFRCSLSSPSKGMVYSNESWQEQHNSKNSKIYFSKLCFSLHSASRDKQLSSRTRWSTCYWCLVRHVNDSE